VEGISEWVEQERKDRADRENREAERKAKTLHARDMMDANQLQGSLARLGIVTPSTAVGQQSSLGNGPIEPVGVPSATTTTRETMNTPSPSPNLAALGNGAVVASVPAAADAGLSPKLIVNGAIDSIPTTPPMTPLTVT